MNPGEHLCILHELRKCCFHLNMWSAVTACSQCVCSLPCRMVPRLPPSTDIKVIDLGSATFDEQ